LILLSGVPPHCARLRVQHATMVGPPRRLRPRRTARNNLKFSAGPDRASAHAASAFGGRRSCGGETIRQKCIRTAGINRPFGRGGFMNE
jgi:hypothetical protein